MLGELSPWHLLILAAVILVLFGAKKLPDSARALGRSMRIFKAETQGLRDGDKTDDVQAGQGPATQSQAAAPQQLPASAPPKDDGTLVNGVPLSEAQRTNQSG
jgi:sec-independent protein translocase protein TatA